MTPVKGFRSESIDRWARHHLAADAAVTSDGLYCFRAIAETCPHWSIVTGGGPASVIKRYGRHFKYVIGVDHSHGMIDAAKKEVGQAGLSNVGFRCLDISSYLDNETREFELVTYVGCLHHQDRRDIPTIIRGLAKRVSPGGLVVIADPIEVAPASVPDEILKWNKKSVGTTIQYSKAVEEPDEAPIPVDLLFDSLKDA